MTVLEDNQTNLGDMTEFNSNAATLERIDRALRNAATASTQNELYYWYKMLGVLRREALVKSKHKACKRDMDLLDPKCERCGFDIPWIKIRENMDVVKDNAAKLLSREDFRNLQILLEDYELQLREFMDSKGMLLRNAKDAMQSFRSGG